MNKKGQATTELALMGTVIIMLLAVLVQQGFLYNSRQALEMYAFRKALELSRAEERGYTLTVARDVITPSFFTGINRQRLQASASVEYNPWKVYDPDEPQYVARKQLLQIGEGMIRNGLFIEVPPMKMFMAGQWQWTPSVIKELDSQTDLDTPKNRRRESTYNYAIRTQEGQAKKTITKKLSSQDIVPMLLTFEEKGTIIENYKKDDWDGTVGDIDIDGSTIPRKVNLQLEETVVKERVVTTPHY
jgi:hypothetical protein